MADTVHTPGEATELFAIAERRRPAGLQVLCIRPDPTPELVEALSRQSMLQGLALDDSPEHAVAVKNLFSGAVPVDTLCADLFATTSYEGRVPADVIVLGTRLTGGREAPLRALVEALPRLCSPDALVLWPLGALDPSRRALLRRMLDRAGFESVDPGPEAAWQYARFVGLPSRLEGARL